MAPKKKRTKEEIEAEKARLVEEARLAEEVRLRREEDARKAADQLEQRRLQLQQEFLAAQDKRLYQEQLQLVSLLQQLQHERSAAAHEQDTAADWQRYLSCNPLPDPCKRADMNNYFTTLAEGTNHELKEALQECQDCTLLAQDCLILAARETMAAAEAAAVAALVIGTQRTSAAAEAPGEQQEGSAAGAMHENGLAATLLADKAQAECMTAHARAAHHRTDAQQLYQHISKKMDAATAGILHSADEYADDKGDVLLTAKQGDIKWGVWVNTHKNPRFKLIDLGGLGVTVEIPKQIALANVAIRVQWHPYNEFQFCTGSLSDATDAATAGAATGNSAAVTDAAAKCLTPLGGVVHLDLLALSAPAKHSRGWTLRQVTPLAKNVSIIPYPVPPAGVEASTWQPDEEPPPFKVSIALPQQLLVPAALHVGWWDARRGVWSEDGVSGLSFDSTSRRLNFNSVHLGPLALLQDTAAALPYSNWTIRPTGGLIGTTAVITLQAAGLPAAEDNGIPHSEVMFEVGKGTVTLLSPDLPQLSQLLGKPLPPWQALYAYEQCGLRLAGAGSAEAQVLGLQEKQATAEVAMCADLALLSGAFMSACSCWNKTAGPDAMLLRLSEVTDWQEGGRTGPDYAARIFKREAAEGDRRVLVVRKQGNAGVMFVDGANTRPDPPPLPDFSTVEGIQAAAADAYCHLHVGLLALLAGPHGDIKDHSRAAALAASEQGLEHVRNTDAVFTGTMAQLLQALRLFSFG